jgi:hypothetical protein
VVGAAQSFKPSELSSSGQTNKKRIDDKEKGNGRVEAEKRKCVSLSSTKYYAGYIQVRSQKSVTFPRLVRDEILCKVAFFKE